MFTFEFLAGIGIIFVLVRMPFHSTLLVCLLDFILGGIWLDCWLWLLVMDLAVE